MTVSGGLCVMISGEPMMLKWHADNLDSLLMVIKYNVALDFNLPPPLPPAVIEHFFIFQEQLPTSVPTLVVGLDPYSWIMWDVLEENQDCLIAPMLELVLLTVITVKMPE